MHQFAIIIHNVFFLNVKSTAYGAGIPTFYLEAEEGWHIWSYSEHALSVSFELSRYNVTIAVRKHYITNARVTV